jgi:primase-polymerase (primpol)-like protein
MLVQSRSASLALDDDVSSMVAVDTAIMSVPDSLADMEIWIGYQLVDDDRKVPVDPARPRTPTPIDATDTSQGVDFRTALEAVHTSRQSPGRQIDGVGLQLDGDDELCLVDIDDCVEDGRVEGWAMDMVRDIGSYTELSPSQTGLHVLVRDEHGVDDGYSSKDKIEVYDSARYATFSGAQLRETSDEIKHIPGIVGAYQRTHNSETTSSTSDSTDESDVGFDAVEADATELSDKQQRLVDALLKWGEEDVVALWEDAKWRVGRFWDESAGEYDRSRADMYLAGAIAFWADESRVLADVDFSERELVEIFRASQLAQRRKCQQRADYVPRTIARARA